MEFVPLTIGSTVAVIHLNHGKHAIIDADAWPVLGRMNWSARVDEAGNWYASALSGRVKMHQILCHCRQNYVPDHANGNTLDNRRENLREATRQQNSQNGRGWRSNSGFKGVYWDVTKRKYVAKISVNRRLTHLGNFDDPAEGARVYDEAARLHYGRFARTNFKANG